MIMASAWKARVLIVEDFHDGTFQCYTDPVGVPAEVAKCSFCFCYNGSHYDLMPATAGEIDRLLGL